MQADVNPSQVAIIGTGRLGRALALRLSRSYQAIVWDVDIRKAKQFAKQHSLRHAATAEQAVQADLVFLCIPGEQNARLLRRVMHSAPAHTKFINLATDCDTREVLRDLGKPGLTVIGLKLIGHFAAIRQNIPVLFVTEHDITSDLQLVTHVLRDIGVVRKGEECKVREINRATTKLTLEFCLQLKQILTSLSCNTELAGSALRAVAVGTILDFPPHRDNAYTTELLQELSGGSNPTLSMAARNMLCVSGEVGA